MKKNITFVWVLLLLVVVVFALTACDSFQIPGKVDSNSSNEGSNTLASVDPNAPTPDDCFYFNLLEDGTYEIFACYYDMPKRIVIPSSYNGKAVTQIGEYFGNGSSSATKIRSVNEIVLPNSITSIEEGAFAGYVRLKSVSLSENITVLKRNVFWRCLELSSVTISAKVTKIEESAFMSCKSLTDINYGGTIAQWNAIEKEESWDSNTGEYTVHCIDGDIAKA